MTSEAVTGYVSTEDAIDRVSGSEKIHAFLTNRRKLGHQFTAKELHKELALAGIDVTEGMVTGFTSRARRKGMLAVVDSDFATNASIYELQNKDPWDFKPRGVGSVAGRTIHRGDQPHLQTSAKPSESAEPEKQITLTSRLIDLAAEIERLENKPEKALADYTSDELMEELKRRMR